MSGSRCPQCGFKFAWYGDEYCAHCHCGRLGRKAWAEIRYLDHFPQAPGEKSRLRLLFAAACLRRVWQLIPDPGTRNLVDLAEAVADGRVAVEDFVAAATPVLGNPQSWGISHRSWVSSPSSGIARAISFLCAGVTRELGGSAVSWLRQVTESVCDAVTADRVSFERWWDYELPPDLEPDRGAAIATARALLNLPLPSDRVSMTVRFLEATAAECRLNVPAEEEAAQCELVRDLHPYLFRPVGFDAAWRTDTTTSLAKGMYEGRDFSAMPILADALQDAGCADLEIIGHCQSGRPHVRGCWLLDLILNVPRS